MHFFLSFLFFSLSQFICPVKAYDLFRSIKILEYQAALPSSPPKNSAQFGKFIDWGLNCVYIMVLFTYLNTEFPSSMEHFVKKHGNYAEKR